jgi:hypothetical protein
MPDFGRQAVSFVCKIIPTVALGHILDSGFDYLWQGNFDALFGGGVEVAIGRDYKIFIGIQFAWALGSLAARFVAGFIQPFTDGLDVEHPIRRWVRKT